MGGDWVVIGGYGFMGWGVAIGCKSPPHIQGLPSIIARVGVYARVCVCVYACVRVCVRAAVRMRVGVRAGTGGAGVCTRASVGAPQICVRPN